LQLIEKIKILKRRIFTFATRVFNLFWNRKPFVVEGAYGLKFSCFSRSALDVHIIREGILPEYLCTNTELSFPSDSVIFDIGANVGYVSFVLLKKYAPNGSVHAFEPDPRNIAQFEKNLALNNLPNIHLHRIALQDRDDVEALEFNIRSLIDADKNENRGISTLADIKIGKVGVTIVPTSTLDKQASALGLKRLDLIKIDVEGSEHLVLRGGLKTVRRFRPVIQYEYSTQLQRLSGSQNAVRTFELISSLEYEQYILKNEKTLELIVEPRSDMADTNILCFPR